MSGKKSYLNLGRASSGWKAKLEERESAVQWHVSQLAARGIRIAEKLVIGDVAGAIQESQSMFELIGRINDLDDMVTEKRMADTVKLKAEMAASPVPDATGTYGAGDKVYEKGTHMDVRR